MATNEYGIPLGATITKAGANDGVQTREVLEAMVIQPHAAEKPDRRDLPHARADGAYGNEPSEERAGRVGMRMQARRRGKTRVKGVGRIRCAVGRGHAFLAHYGRIARRNAHRVSKYLAWVQMAVCIIILRYEDNEFVR